VGATRPRDRTPLPLWSRRRPGRSQHGGVSLQTANDPAHADPTIYRRSGDHLWREVPEGLPQTRVSLRALLAAHPAERGSSTPGATGPLPLGRRRRQLVKAAIVRASYGGSRGRRAR
jgi:hypothetical protein